MPKNSGSEMEEWIKGQFPTHGINPKDNSYYPLQVCQKNLIRAHPVKSDEISKKIKNTTRSIWSQFLRLDTPEEQERFIYSSYKICGKRGKSFVGMDQFREAIYNFAQISPKKKKAKSKRDLIDQLLVQYEGQLMSGSFSDTRPAYTAETNAESSRYYEAPAYTAETNAESSRYYEAPAYTAETNAESSRYYEAPAYTAETNAESSRYYGAPSVQVQEEDPIYFVDPQPSSTIGALGSIGGMDTNFQRAMYNRTANVSYEEILQCDQTARYISFLHGQLPGLNKNVFPDMGGVSPTAIPVTNSLPRPTRQNRAMESGSGDEDYSKLPSLSEQMLFLDDRGETEMNSTGLSNSVLVSENLLRTSTGRRFIGQYSLLGTVLPLAEENRNRDQLKQETRFFHNTNVPTSFFICGLQGSGKSHTLSCLLENYLIPSKSLGVLKSPLSALVLHYDAYSTKQSFRPCEAVFLAGMDPVFSTEPTVRSVTVLVSPSNFPSMRVAYGQLPQVSVRPLKLRPKDLTCGSMQTLMSVDQTQAVPLYMSQVVRILREMAAESEVFNYHEFKRQIENQRFRGVQKEMLEQRLSLLESFLDLGGGWGHDDVLVADEPGTLTIVDLSCPFVNKDTACSLFNICVELFLASPRATGKIIAVDEAHKYMTDTPAARVLTEQLLAIIRLQRHYNTRVIIATQEPTISPLLIGLASVKIIHRFSSIDWYNALEKHLPKRKRDATSEDDQWDQEQRTYFDWIAQLTRGQAVVFDPSAILGSDGDRDLQELMENQKAIMRVYDRCFKVKIRRRMTLDGGRSIVCVTEDFW